MKSLRTLFTILTALVAIPMVGEFFIKWAEQNGWYNDPNSRVEGLLKWLQEWTGNSFTVAITWLLIGATLGMWASFFIKNKAATIVTSDESNNEKELVPILNKYFHNEKVVLDGYRYVGCRFENVTFIYDGGPTGLERNYIGGVFFETNNEHIKHYIKLLHEFGFLNVPVIGKDGEPLKPTSKFPDKKEHQI